MDAERKRLMQELRQAGFSRSAIDAAWPDWWGEQLAQSPSGRAELRFALARRLGLVPEALLGERVEFIWNDEARFKHLKDERAGTRAAITSFGMTIARSLLQAVPPGPAMIGTVDAERLRLAILARRAAVDLPGLISACWAVGIPVIHLRVFPLSAKTMHAMVVRVEDRGAILLGQDAAFPAQLAFTLAHEIGHLLLGHLEGAPALIDAEDPALATERDAQEDEADAFALTLLTGTAEPDIQADAARFNAPMLANAVQKAGPAFRIDPGTLALCLAHRLKIWPVAMAALRLMDPVHRSVWQDINAVARQQIGWDALSDEAADYLRAIMGGAGA